MKRLAAMGAYRLSMYLKEEGNNEYWGAFPRLLDSTVTRELMEDIEDNYLYSFTDEKGPLGKLYGIIDPYDETGALAWCALETALLYYMDSSIGEVFEHIHPSAKNGATIALASRLVYGDADIFDDYLRLKNAFEKIELILQAEYPARNFAEAHLRADDRLVEWINDGNSLLRDKFVADGRLHEDNAATVWDNKRQEIIEEIKTGAVKDKNLTVIAVSGENGSGRSFLVRQIAKELEKPLLVVEMNYFGTIDTVVKKWRRVLREAALNDILVCVKGIAKSPSWETMLTIIADEYEETVTKAYKENGMPAPSERPLFITTDENVKPVYVLKQVVIHKTLTLPDMAERAYLWDYFADKYLGGMKIPSQDLAVKMKLTLGNMEKVVKRLAMMPEEKVRDGRSIFKVCYEMLDDGRYDNIKRVETKYTYDDLKLEDAQKKVIMDICAQVEHRKKVLSDWGLKERYSYGTNVSAIFSGPPGTGKTMAAHVMAGILGLELFKVDISQIVDKYIGETEKRLEEVFKRAEKSNMILFFDEADAIIGKRSETKEAKDKYANTEVAYLLQRMEEYDGIVILATNYSQNIDAAFMRRIRFTVHFPMPDEKTRKEIWMSAMSADTPKGEIDYDYLASQFEFSGGQIKNVVWNACFFAADDSGVVEMKHIVRAIQMELTKDKKVSFLEALGRYAHLVY